MTLLFDKPDIALRQRPGADKLDRPEEVSPVLTIGFINNMSDAALQATERQFLRLLKAAKGHNRIRFLCFSLPSVRRSQASKSRIDQQYTDIADLGRLQIDGLIVTGAEPSAARLPQESLWDDLTAVIDWAEANTRSTIWSCLAAHAAVLHLDGIERRQLATKCSGVYDCAKVGKHWLTEGIPSPIRISHSRLNGLCERDLETHGYQLLTVSEQAGVDIFVKRLRSQFIFFQGHPEYDPLSLEREYLRDISRYLAGARHIYPAIPAGYYDAATERKLAEFETRATVDRRPALSDELPDRALRHEISASSAAALMFQNWLRYLSTGDRTATPHAG